MAFCKERCRKVRNKDLMTYIDPDGGVSHYQSAQHGETVLAQCDGLTVRLDLHNVLDTLSNNASLPMPARKICALSYVGPLTTTRIMAQKDMQTRIANGQIHCGFLVYKRGRRRGTDEEKNTFQAPGSKAWVNRHLPAVEDRAMCFMDDSYDHYASVTSLQLSTMHTVHFDPHHDLCVALQKFKDTL